MTASPAGNTLLLKRQLTELRKREYHIESVHAFTHSNFGQSRSGFGKLSWLDEIRLCLRRLVDDYCCSPKTKS